METPISEPAPAAPVAPAEPPRPFPPDARHPAPEDGAAPPATEPAAAGVEILLVEDKDPDARLIEVHLHRAQQRQAGPPFSLRRAATLAAALEILDHSASAGLAIGAVLLDLSLPDSRGLETFRTLHRHAPHTPVVVLTGLADEDLAAQAVSEGAQDYLVKGHADGQVLVRSLRYAIARSRAELDRAAHARERAARAEAEAERQRLYALFEHAPAAVAILRGPAHVVVFANATFARLAGGGRELTGRPIREVFPEPDAQPPLELLDRVYSTGAPHSGTEAHLQWRRDGSPRDGYFNYVFQPTLGPEGDVDGVFVHAVEVTEQVLARRREEERLLEAIRVRDDFLAAASHDLKNPLAAVHGTAQMLQRTLARTGTVPPDRLAAALGSLTTSVARMTAQIDELLDVARLRLGQALPLERSPTDLVALAHSAATTQQAATDLHHISVETTESQLVGQWDARRLARVLGNLLSNAIKYSPRGGAIRVAISRSDGSAVLSVHDEGVGIPPADLDRIFERFQRAGNVAGAIEGAGIGLAAVKQIVEQHGGAIHVESAEGRGSTFTVLLPLTPPESPCDDTKGSAR